MRDGLRKIAFSIGILLAVALFILTISTATHNTSWIPKKLLEVLHLESSEIDAEELVQRSGPVGPVGPVPPEPPPIAQSSMSYSAAALMRPVA